MAKKIYKVTQAQYKTLQEGGTITVGGVSYTYQTGSDVAYVVVDPTQPEYRLRQQDDAIQLTKDGSVVSDLSVAYADRSGYSTYSHTMVYPSTDAPTYKFDLNTGGTINGAVTFNGGIDTYSGITLQGGVADLSGGDGVNFYSLDEMTIDDGTTSTTMQALFDAKQDKLTAGTNVTLSNNTISAKDTTYTLGTSGNQIKITPSAGSAQTVTVPYATKALQDEYGNNIASSFNNRVMKSGDKLSKGSTFYWSNYIYGTEPFRREGFCFCMPGAVDNLEFHKCPKDLLFYAFEDSSITVTSTYDGNSSTKNYDASAPYTMANSWHIRQLFIDDTYGAFCLWIDELSTKPWILTIRKTSDFEYSDVLKLCFWLSNLNMNSTGYGAFTDWKLEVETAADTWTTIWDRTGVTDYLNGMSCPLCATAGYQKVRGIRITVTGAVNAQSYPAANKINISKLKLLTYRGYSSPADCYYVVPTRGGADMSGNYTISNGNLTVNGTTIARKIYPSGDYSYDLGDASHRWSGIYGVNGLFDTVGKSGYGNGFKFTYSGTNYNVGNLLPWSNNLYYLGSSDKQWNRLYATTVYSDTANLHEPTTQVSGNLSVSSRNLLPTAHGNRLYGIPPERAIVEESLDAGATWTVKTDFSSISGGKSGGITNLLNGWGSSWPMPKTSDGKNTGNAMMRFTFALCDFGSAADAAADSEKLALWNQSNYVWYKFYGTIDRLRAVVSGPVSVNVWVYVAPAPAAGSEPTWTEIISGTAFRGWPGENMASRQGQKTIGTKNYALLRIVFRTATSSGTYDDTTISAQTSNMAICDLAAYGTLCYGAGDYKGFEYYGSPFSPYSGSYNVSYCYSSIYPKKTEKYLLGTDSLRWNSISSKYFYGDSMNSTYVNTDYINKKDASDIASIATIRPNSTNAVDLGTSSKLWKNVYATNISNGTKTKAVADLVTKLYNHCITVVCANNYNCSFNITDDKSGAFTIGEPPIGTFACMGVIQSGVIWNRIVLAKNSSGVWATAILANPSSPSAGGSQYAVTSLTDIVTETTAL